MTIEQIGYNSKIEELVIENSLREFEIGRVISEHKERYIVRASGGEYEAEITGNLRFTAESRSDFPAVGDWVALTVYGNDLAIIHKIIPRFSTISRQAVGQFGGIQIIAANVDYALLVQACDRDFNINRLERYLTICNSSKVAPIIVLTKRDLLPENSVKEAVEDGRIDRSAYENYLKMQKEREFFETSESDKRRKEKIFGKILKEYKEKNIKGKG